MKSTSILILTMTAYAVVGKPVIDATTTIPTTTDAPTTLGTSVQTETPTEAAQEPQRILLLIPEQPPQVIEEEVLPPSEAVLRVTEEVPAEDSAEEEAAAAAAIAGAEDLLIVRPLHRHAKCHYYSYAPVRYPVRYRYRRNPQRRQGFFQAPRRTTQGPFRPFRPRPAELRPLQEQPPLQIVY